MAVLIGALIGLGSMASSNELTVMRAAGRSLARIVWGVMKPVLLVVVVVLLVAEFVSPRTEQYAEAWRLEQRQGEGAMLTTAAAGSSKATAFTALGPFGRITWCWI